MSNRNFVKYNDSRCTLQCSRDTVNTVLRHMKTHGITGAEALNYLVAKADEHLSQPAKTGISDDMPESLQWYKSNSKDFAQHYMDAIAYRSADNFIEKPDVRVYTAIADATRCAYGHTSEPVEADTISDFLAEGIAGKRFTIEQMLATGPYTMLDAVAEHDFDKIGKGE